MLAQEASAGEAWTFWLLAPIAVIGALGMVLARNAVHSALWLVLTMLSLGVFFVVQQAPFLGLVQVVVYTGAIMMLFLFVLMLVGRDVADSLIETLRGQRVAAVVLGLGLAALLATGTYRALSGTGSVGLAAANQQYGTNPAGRSRRALQPVAGRVRGDRGPADHRGGGRADAHPHRPEQGAQLGQPEWMRRPVPPGNYPGPRPGPGSTRPRRPTSRRPSCRTARLAPARVPQILPHA